MMPHFQRELLPATKSFYERELGSLTRPNRKGWALGRCPFHPSKSGKSFGVNLDNGAFFCFGCGAKGADPVSFVMRRDKTNFKTAAKTLGAWRDAEPSEHERRESAARNQERERIRLAAADLAQHEHEMRMQYRETIHTSERIARDMAARLQSKAEGYETAGEVLVLALEESRKATAAYMLLSFGTIEARANFLQHPATCDLAIAQVLYSGIVRDDHGHILEVGL